MDTLTAWLQDTSLAHALPLVAYAIALATVALRALPPPKDGSSEAYATIFNFVHLIANLEARINADGGIGNLTQFLGRVEDAARLVASAVLQAQSMAAVRPQPDQGQIGQQGAVTVHPFVGTQSGGGSSLANNLGAVMAAGLVISGLAA